MAGPEIELIEPDSPALWDDTRAVLRDYQASLAVDLCFQGFEAELLGLPGVYLPPHGLLLLATVEGAVAGCGAFRPLPDADYPNSCEMKRLFVRPAFRGFGLGRLLAQALMDRATESGYSNMLLDTLDEMEAARGLYESLGFAEVPPFYFNPLPGAHYLKADLGRSLPSRHSSL
jgi:putative acetyltransferase